MNLTFDYLELESFRSFLDPARLDFSSLESGVHFVNGVNEVEPAIGSNGSGKSTIFAALCWGLYGKTPNGLRRTDIVPWQEADLTRVTIGINGHMIERTGATNGLTVDNSPVGQDEVDKLIGLPFTVFVHAILFGQNQPLFIDLEPREKLALFSTMLDLDRWDRRAKAASDRAANVQQELATNETDLAVLRARQADSDKRRQAVQTTCDEWEDQQHRRLAEIEKELGELNKRLPAVQANKERAELDLDSAGVQLNLLATDIAKAEAELAVIERNYNDFALDDQAKKQELATLQEALTSVCPTCGQSVSQERIRQIKQRIERLQKQRGIPPVTIQRLTEHRATLTTLKEAERRFRATSDKAQESLNFNAPMLAEIQGKLRTLQINHQERERETNPYLIQVQELRRSLADLAIKIKQAEERQALLQRRLARAQYWAAIGFRQLKLLQVEQVVGELAATTNQMLPEIGLEDWTLSFAIERESQSGTVIRGINVDVTPPVGERASDRPIRFQAFSGGEGQRLRLVTALALSEVLLAHAGTQPNLLILDEPSTSLSPEGIDSLIAFLAAYGIKSGRRILLTDQHALPSGAFASVLTVRKTAEGSRLDGP